MHSVVFFDHPLGYLSTSVLKKTPCAVNERAIDMGEQAVNVKNTMRELIALGNLLEIADMGSNGFQVNVAVKVFRKFRFYVLIFK